MKFDTLDTSWSLSALCLPIAQIFSKMNHSQIQLSLLLTLTFLSFPTFLFFSILLSKHLSFYLFPLMLNSTRKYSDVVFNGIKTKYQLNLLSLFYFIPLFDLFFYTHTHNHTHTHTHTHIYIYIYIYIYIINVFDIIINKMIKIGLEKRKLVWKLFYFQNMFCNSS